MRFPLAGVCLLTVLAALGAPLLAPVWPVVAAGLYEAFSVVCHQDAGRSFAVAGVPSAACARCVGSLLGLSLALAWTPAWGRRQVIGVGVTAAALWLVEALVGPWPHALRLAAGLPLGLALGVPLAQAVRPRAMC